MASRLRAYGYVRVSVDEEDGNNASIASQIAAIEAYCADKGIELVQVFDEPNVSGQKLARKQFDRMIAAATQADRPVDVIISYALSRFSRSMFTQVVSFAKLDQANVEFVSLTEAFSNDATGQMMRGVVGLMNEKYAKDAAQFTRRDRRRNALRGFFNGGNVVFGYESRTVQTDGKKERKKLFIVAAEASAVRRIYDLAEFGNAQGPMGTRSIAEWMRLHGYTVRELRRDNDVYGWRNNANGDIAYGGNGLNQYSNAGDTQLTWDMAGNLYQNRGATYGFDAENRLTSVTGPRSGTLSYDATGRLARVTSGIFTTDMLYDGDDLVAEYDGFGAIARRTVHGPGVDEPIVSYEAGNRIWLQADAHGSVAALSDDAGALVEANSTGPGASPGSGIPVGSAIPGRLTCPNSAFTTTRRGPTRPTSGGSSSLIRSVPQADQTSTNMPIATRSISVTRTGYKQFTGRRHQGLST